jgi:hypothetical protein
MRDTTPFEDMTPRTINELGRETGKSTPSLPVGASPTRRPARDVRTQLILGSTVCWFHGGAAKHVKAAARARIENAQDLMAKELLTIAITAESEAVKLAAIRDALDRGGLRPPAEVVLSQGETKPYEELFQGISTASRAESRRARGVPDAQDNLAGVEGGHLHGSLQEGVKRQSSSPPTGLEPDAQPGPAATPLRREFRGLPLRRPRQRLRLPRAGRPRRRRAACDRTSQRRKRDADLVATLCANQANGAAGAGGATGAAGPGRGGGPGSGVDPRCSGSVPPATAAESGAGGGGDGAGAGVDGVAPSSASQLA